MKSVLFLMCAMFFALGCGPRGLPVSDVSSYKLDYYDYAKNRLPIEEKIIDGQCLLWLQPATNAMFADYDNPQDAADAKTQFIGALRWCGQNLLAFAEHIDEVSTLAFANGRRLQRKINSGEPYTNEGTQDIWRAEQARPLLAKMGALQRAKYTITENLALCLYDAPTESDETRCLEEAAARLEKVLPKK